ncbi:MAG: hypothetical protein Q9157_007831 [Trypethelium eluteriae]
MDNYNSLEDLEDRSGSPAIEFDYVRRAVPTLPDLVSDRGLASFPEGENDGSVTETSDRNEDPRSPSPNLSTFQLYEDDIIEYGRISNSNDTNEGLELSDALVFVLKSDESEGNGDTRVFDDGDSEEELEALDPLAFILQPDEELFQLETFTKDVLQQFKRSGPGLFAADCTLHRTESWFMAVSRLAERNYRAFNNLRKSASSKYSRVPHRLTFFVQDELRSKVAKTIFVTCDTLRALSQRAKFFLSDPTRDQVHRTELESFPASVTLNVGNMSDRKLEHFYFLNLLISVGICSYAGSHSREITPNPAYESAEEIQILNHGRASFVWRKRRLLCLDSFIGGPTWLFMRHDSNSNGFVLSTTVSAFADLWGPVWGIEADNRPGLLSLFTERGEIVEVGLPTGKYLTREEEIPCHWRRLSHREHLIRREEIQASLHEEPPSNVFSANSLLLIGMPDSLRLGLQLNLGCPRDYERDIQQGNFDKVLAGSHGGGWELNTRAGTISGGHFVTFGATQTYRSAPASTQKDRIYAIVQSARSLAHVLAVVSLHVGLEISICTRNAQRISLWEALRISCAIPVPK